jgi:hypothetical protein
VALDEYSPSVRRFDECSPSLFVESSSNMSTVEPGACSKVDRSFDADPTR